MPDAQCATCGCWNLARQLGFRAGSSAQLSTDPSACESQLTRETNYTIQREMCAQPYAICAAKSHGNSFWVEACAMALQLVLKSLARQLGETTRSRDPSACDSQLARTNKFENLARDVRTTLCPTCTAPVWVLEPSKTTGFQAGGCAQLSTDPSACESQLARRTN